MDLLEICSSEYLSLENVKFYIETYPETDPNMTDSQGKTPLHHICYNKNATMDIIEYLVSKGANVNSVDGIGNLPIHAACYNSNVGNALEMVKYFVVNNVNICQKNDLGLTPLYVACLRDNVNKIFLRYLVLTTIEMESNENK